MAKLFVYSHDQMKMDLRSIYRKMHLNEYVPDVVYGITRGGLIPSTYVSHYFAKPLNTINVSFRDGRTQDKCDSIVEDLLQGRQVLLVDDIVDSGETLVWIYEETFNQLRKLNETNVSLMDNLKVVSLVYNLGCQVFTPTWYGTEINKIEDNVWVVFDWEQ